MTAREGEERGGGFPYTEEERLQRHMTLYPGTVLPERGYGLTIGEIVCYTLDDLRVALDVMENTLDVGEKVRVRICSEAIPTEQELALLHTELVAMGEHASYPTATVIDGIPTTDFDLMKGSPALPMAVIPLIGLFGILGIITFGVLKIESITKALLPLTLVIVGGVIIIAGLLRQPAARIVERKYLTSTYPKKALAAR